MGLLDQYVDKSTDTGQEPWAVCTSTKWTKADKDAVTSLYHRYGRAVVLGLLKAYASAKIAGTRLPPLARPLDLLNGWAKFRRAVNQSQKPGDAARQVAENLGKPDIAVTAQLTMDAYVAWIARVKAVPATDICYSLARAYLDTAPNPSGFAEHWHSKTMDPWHPYHGLALLTGRQFANDWTGRATAWMVLLATTEPDAS